MDMQLSLLPQSKPDKHPALRSGSHSRKHSAQGELQRRYVVRVHGGPPLARHCSRLVGDASSQSEHSFESLHHSQVLASMSKHFHDGDAVGVVRRERFGCDGGKHLRN